MDDQSINKQSTSQDGETAVPNLEMIPCPNCQQPLDVHNYHQTVHCPLCQYDFVLYGRTCPNCYHYHEKETAVCCQCGESINRICRQCHTANWGGAETCRSCGTSLDIFERISITTTKRLAQQMNAAAAFKQTEEAASQKRMEEMQAIEQERQAELYRRRQKQQQEERTLMYLTVGILLAVSVIAIFYFILF